MRKWIQDILLRWFCKDAYYNYGQKMYGKGLHDGEIKWQSNTARLVRDAVRQGQENTWKIMNEECANEQAKD